MTDLETQGHFSSNTQRKLGKKDARRGYTSDRFRPRVFRFFEKVGSAPGADAVDGPDVPNQYFDSKVFCGQVSDDLDIRQAHFPKNRTSFFGGPTSSKLG